MTRRGIDVDVDLRKLRYFVAVAEELHFGRAAERLFIAQPALSRQVRALEEELGVQLLRRDRRGTALTPAGAQLLEDALPLLAASAAMVRRVTAAATEKPVFTIGFMPGITVTPAVRALKERHASVSVRLVRTSWNDQVEVLRDGRADVSIVRLPVDQNGLTVQPLFTEPRLAVLPADHPLAGKPAVGVVDLADDHLLQDPEAVPEWRDVARELRTGERDDVPPLHSVEEKLELVASGAGICVLPLSTAAFYTRPDVVAVPVDDIGPSRVCLAWIAARRSRLIRDFAEVASALAPAAVR
ncbi:LysR substrate-binding domain-containing protein [Streptomyces thermoviolaceus]|uniref:LysR family transcriptional regulator n=1 Tax=Streptomyces TaxID=1883 RepID=UPI00198CC606|nr:MULTISPECIES: LysR substrate-binding domain-containing protein [Streptomyces]MCM3263321.1 LysR substrate-binding domain-containing protein [Streptomyces thermoviolaceus]GGV71536.1 LysR family transcriptional regulator [Streptomyces thermoviolaceus subsp. apingens]